MIASIWLGSWFGEFACSGSGPTPTAATTPPSTVTDSADSRPTGETGTTPSETAHTGVIEPSDTGPDLGDLLMIYASSGDECVTGDTYSPVQLTAQGSPDRVQVDRFGSAEGCGCYGTNTEAWLDASTATITVGWNLGPCDAFSCCSLAADIRGVPPGTYTVEDGWDIGTYTSTTVTVP